MSLPSVQTKRCVQLDGLRAVAIILVVLSHTDILVQGGVANSIFLGISGFLFINPFRDNYEAGFRSPVNVFRFYLGRAVRILPAYYIVLLCVFLITGFSVIPKEDFIKILYFGEPYMHLWYIHDLVRIYLVVPAFMMLYVIFSERIKIMRNDLFGAGFFALLAVFVLFVLRFGFLYDFYLYQFLFGMSAAYVFRFIRRSERISSLRNHKAAGTALILLFYLSVVLTAEPVLSRFIPSYSGTFIGWDYPYITSIAMSCLVLLTAIYTDSILGKVLASKPMLFIGKLTLPIYLIHYFLLDRLTTDYRILSFICVFGVSLILSWVLNFIIDKLTSMITKKCYNQGHGS